MRVVGLPLHLWSREVFRKIGNGCEGFIVVDEDMNSLSKLQWARILVKLVRRDFPSTIQIVVGSVSFAIQLWWEIPPWFVQVVLAGVSLVKDGSEIMESTFVNGLLPKIQVEICLLQPCGLGHLMEMAQRVEHKNLTLWAAVNQRTQRTPKYCRLQIRGIGRLGKIFKLRQRLLARKQRTNNGRF